jgi:hypothetical protein
MSGIDLSPLFISEGVDVPGTYIELPSGEKAQQINFNSDILAQDTGNNQGVISNITNSTEVKTYLSNTGHLEVVLEGPAAEVGGDGTKSIWKNGEYQPGYADYIPVGNKTAFENELKLITLKEIKKRNLSNEDGVVYPSILNMNDGLPVDQLDKEAIKKAQEDQASAQPFEFPEFGRVDRILQQLSLRNLKYPIDADYGNTQDYIQINQFTYKPPSGNIFFPEGPEGGMSEGFSQAVDSLTQGVPSGTPKEKAIGLVKLPMPNSLADSNNVSWGPDQLNALTAAAVAASMGASGEAITAIRNFASTMSKRTPMENVTEGLGKVGEGVENLLSELGIAMGDFNAADKKNINLLGRTVIGSQLLNLLQFQVSPESILSRGAGVIPNSNLALLFNAPTLREFTFSWKMSPRSREEATRVNNILRFFKQGMAPKKASNTKSGGGSFFLGTPNIFDIHFKTAKTKDYQILDRNDSVLRIKTCACTGAAVNYTPEGMWNAYEKGQPVAITLTLRFNELEPIFDTDYDNNYFNYDPNRTDLLPVPTDAVGY